MTFLCRLLADSKVEHASNLIFILKLWLQSGLEFVVLDVCQFLITKKSFIIIMRWCSLFNDLIMLSIICWKYLWKWKFQNENMCDLISFRRYLICQFIFSTWMSAVDCIRRQQLIPFYVTTCNVLLKLIIIDFALLTRFFLILVLELSMFISNSVEITFIELLNWPHWTRLDYRCWRFEWLFSSGLVNPSLSVSQAIQACLENLQQQQRKNSLHLRRSRRFSNNLFFLVESNKTERKGTFNI